jgi:hypothetical protein
MGLKRLFGGSHRILAFGMVGAPSFKHEDEQTAAASQVLLNR